MLHIAIADDHVILRKGLVLLLSAIDYAVDIEADDGAELIDKIDHANSLPDICILDISMPVMDGYETLKRIKHKWPDIRVIILSIYYNDYVIVKTIRDGAACCLPKETNLDELQRAIAHVYSQGYYHTEFVKRVINHENAAKLKITERELNFMRLCCGDMSYKQIAEQMQVSPRTIDGYRDALYIKMGVQSRSALVLFALQSGLMGLAENYMTQKITVLDVDS